MVKISGVNLLDKQGVRQKGMKEYQVRDVTFTARNLARYSTRPHHGSWNWFLRKVPEKVQTL